MKNRSLSKQNCKILFSFILIFSFTIPSQTLSLSKNQKRALQFFSATSFFGMIGIWYYYYYVLLPRNELIKRSKELRAKELFPKTNTQHNNKEEKEAEIIIAEQFIPTVEIPMVKNAITQFKKRLGKNKNGNDNESVYVHIGNNVVEEYLQKSDIQNLEKNIIKLENSSLQNNEKKRLKTNIAKQYKTLQEQFETTVFACVECFDNHKKSSTNKYLELTSHNAIICQTCYDNLRDKTTCPVCNKKWNKRIYRNVSFDCPSDNNLKQINNV